MLNPQPAWTFASKRPLTQWYGHVHLLPDVAVGQWFCVDRDSGELKWQRRYFRPTTIVGFDSDVIVASEMRSDGPWTASFGCYGISLADGRLLWTSHRAGIWGRLVRWLDFIPGFTNDLRDAAAHVAAGKVYCDSGRVLDVTTGRLLDRIDPGSAERPQAKPSVGSQFYRSGTEPTHPAIQVAPDLFLRHAQETEGWQRGNLQIAAETQSGNRLWTFSIDQLGRHSTSNYYSYRLAPPYLYLIVSDEPNLKPHPTKRHYVEHNPTLWHVVTLDIRSGRIVQDFSLGKEKSHECRIEDVDDRGLLISDAERRLSYFARTDAGEPFASPVVQSEAS